MKVGRNAPCPCGSGRKFKHCCGKAGQTETSQQVPALLREALRLQQDGDGEQAETLCRHALAVDPCNSHAHYFLGLALRDRGDAREAATRMERAFALGLTDPAAHYQFAMLLLEIDRGEEAIHHLERAVQGKTDFTAATLALGKVHYEKGDFAAAEVQFRRVLHAEPANWTAHHHLAYALLYQDREEEALAQLETPIALAPADAERLATQATLFELLNQTEASAGRANRALDLDPDNASALFVLAKLARRAERPSEALAWLERVPEDAAIPAQAATLWNERGHILDQLGDYRAAFGAFTRSKQELAVYRNIIYDPRVWEEPLDRAEAYFQARRTAVDWPSPEPISPTPIFVVGFFRSGSTLLEQMLGSHPNILAAGELDLLGRLQDRIGDNLGAPFPKCLDRWSNTRNAEFVAPLRRAYADAVDAPAMGWTGEQWIVDKNLFNIMRLPLIRFLFPDAPILRIVRHPLDTVLSCYFHNFRDRNEWSYSLHDIARLYARVHRHVRAMEQMLGLEYLEVKYEKLVTHPEIVLREIFQILGEPWNSACLYFHDQPRVARTASYDQVARPLYTSSVARHRDYRPFIDREVIERLAPVIEDLDYEPVAGTTVNV